MNIGTSESPISSSECIWGSASCSLRIYGQTTILMPNADASVSSETAVAYIDADGNEQTITGEGFTVVSSSYDFGAIRALPLALRSFNVIV